MNGNYSQQENTPEKPPRRKFWQNLLIMDSGDLKKILSLSSLMLSLAILFVYAIAYVLLMPLIDKVMGWAPASVATAAESVIPALIASAAVMITWPLYKDKRILPAAYLWLTGISLLIFVIVLINLRDDPAAVKSFLYFYLWIVLPALIIGNFAAWNRYRKFLWN